ncbi:hypothetical protein RFM68_18005 [Mesorhizobium sp. MSK_1335]|uniref:Uncharacterized protein n=1 Tax=Mesorhizobium montanum TaxID=3072323 RepID=A0ABU4ZLZ2_9HYPH|nr:hypothetical protein [Mesorhizobium sp. MSK_1335]MDX8526396.1 hypothetical protein [Mesorhizobium sp. MSK_1335]
MMAGWHLIGLFDLSAYDDRTRASCIGEFTFSSWRALAGQHLPLPLPGISPMGEIGSFSAGVNPAT